MKKSDFFKMLDNVPYAPNVIILEDGTDDHDRAFNKVHSVIKIYFKDYKHLHGVSLKYMTGKTNELKNINELNKYIKWLDEYKILNNGK